ncbi:hypothetical protein H0H92_000547 [Tricholoma furcatifolium]|nr:hypothetical protein H0H92_000547 [Tricholoma furcatifolium]
MASAVKREIIDLDAPIDLTEDPIPIDLTGDGDEGPSSPRSHRPPRRTKVSERTYIPLSPLSRPTGPPSAVNIKVPSAVPKLSISEDGPPAKKRKVEEVSITQDEDEDDEIIVSSPRPAPKRVLGSECRNFERKTKKLKRNEDDATDEEEAYERCHAGYDINNEDIWKHLEVNKSKIVFEVEEHLQHLTLDSSTSAPRPQYRLNFGNPPGFAYPYTEIPEWKPFKKKRWISPAPPRNIGIDQRGSYVAVASAATGGHPDAREMGEIDPYNRDGSIILWNGSPVVLPGHFRQKNGTQLFKYYTVNDVKFDPCSSSFVSVGNDKCACVWVLNEETNLYELDNSRMCSSPPNTLSSLSGVQGHRAIHSVGAMVWGNGPTKDRLYASSEPLDATRYTGYHKAIDAETGKAIYAFDEDGAGDDITVTKDGLRLALVTRREDRAHSLRIYDVGRSDGEAVLSLGLDPFASDIEGEVNRAAFSPDGIYLAMGRNDNHIHVYDSRYLNRLLYDYEHHGPSRTNPGVDSYGVVKVEWVEEDAILPFGLITGGNDGCIRFWSPRQAVSNRHNGAVLAEMTSDIATFSLGDRYKKEHPLVVGDSTGEVKMFDFSPQGFHSIYR